MSTVLSMTKLGLKTGNHFLLKDINWEVKTGEHWIVLGPNGASKTTLLAVASGFISPTHGELRILNETPCEENILQLRQRIGFVSSSFFGKYYSNESSLNIVLSGLKGTLGPEDGIGDSDIVRAKALLSAFGLQRKACYPFDILSNGEKQAVLISRALIRKPELLLLDEPGSGMDFAARESLRSSIRDLSKNSDISIVQVTHYAEEISDDYQYAFCLKNGKEHAIGTLDEIMTDSVLTSCFGQPIAVTKKDHQFDLQVEAPSVLLELMRG